MKSIFTGKVVETKWQKGSIITWGDEKNWHLNKRYTGRVYPLGWSYFNAKEYNRVLGREVIHSGHYDFTLSAGDIFNIDGRKVLIETVVYNSDNSVTYHTSNIINTVLITQEEAEAINHWKIK